MGNRAISDDQIFRLSKLFQSVIDHRGAGCSPGGGMVGALGFRVGPALVMLYAFCGLVKNNERTKATLLECDASIGVHEADQRPILTLCRFSKRDVRAF
jgi:hypothetical protein